MRSLIILFLITIYSTNLFATKIFVIDVEKLINENIYYEKFMEEIEKNQISEKNELNLIEKEIVDLQNEIEQSKLILDQNEINKLIEDYNIQLNKFNILIESYNLHYQNEIINKRKIVLKEIIVLVEKFAKDNNIRASVGFGIKYYSPIGPIGFSWGFPIMDEEYDIKRMFLFSVGNID